MDLAVHALLHDVPRDERSHSTRELRNRRVDGVERTTLRLRRHLRHERLERNHAREDADEQQDVDHGHDGQRRDAQVGVDQHHDDGDRRPHEEHAQLAERVRGLAHERPSEDRRDAGHQVDDGKVVQRDAEIVHGERAAERHEHEAAGRQEQHRHERQQVVRLADRVEQVFERAVFLRRLQVVRDRFHVPRDEQAADHAQHHQREERHMPVPLVR